jgi:flagellar protein FlaG
MPIGNGINTVAYELPMDRPARSVQREQKSADLKESDLVLFGSGKANSEEIVTAASDFQHISLAFNRKLRFVVDHESREILIKVIDSETDKVIKVLPPEELQRLHSRIRESLGFLFDEKV